MFRLSMLAMMLLPALAQQKPTGSFVALRYDDSHVIFIAAADKDQGFRRQREPGLPAPVASLAQGGSLFEISAEEIAQLKTDRPVTVRGGDHYELIPGTGASMLATIQKLVVQETCSARLIGALARIDDPDLSRYRQLRAKYYLIRSTRKENPRAVPAGLPRSVQVRAGDRAQLEALLKDAMLAAVKELGYDPAAETRPSIIREWRALDAALVNGQTKLTYDVQAVSLGPKYGLRYYVKALWTLNGAPAFRLSAWIRPGDRIVIEQIQDVLRTRTTDLADYPQDLEALPKLLNVIAFADGSALVLIYSYGAESLELSFLEYDGEKLQRTGIDYGYGC